MWADPISPLPVYEKIIERVNTSKSQNQQVRARTPACVLDVECSTTGLATDPAHLPFHSQALTLAVKLLKTHLPHHVPSKEALHKLDQFCISIKSDSPTTTRVRQAPVVMWEKTQREFTLRSGVRTVNTVHPQFDKEAAVAPQQTWWIRWNRIQTARCRV